MSQEIPKELLLLRRAYLACKPPGDILRLLEESCSNGIPREEDLVLHILQNPVSRKYQPHKDYRVSLLKQLISFYEKHADIQDSFYDELARVMAVDCGSGENFVSYQLIPADLSSCVTLRETRSFVTQGTTGFKSWPASKILVEVLLKQNLTNRNILELGAGVGLTGLCILKRVSDLGSYTFTDCHPGVLDLIKENIEVNFGCLPKARVQLLDWCVGGSINADLIVGADIVFDKDIIPSLVKLITEASRKNSCEVIIASVIRNEETYQTFLECCMESNLQLEILSVDEFEYFEEITAEKYEVVKLSIF